MEMIQDLTHESKNIQSIDIHKNVGKSEAIRVGMNHLLTQGHTYIGFWDADLAAPLHLIDGFLQVFADNERIKIVSGKRTRSIERNFFRHILSRIFAKLANKYLKIAVDDPQCGAKIFNTEIVNLYFSKPFVSRWFFDVEVFSRIITTKKHKLENILFEYPIEDWKDVSNSRLLLKDYLLVPIELWKIHRANKT